MPDANKTGVAHEAINNIRRGSKTMTEQEARQILGVTEQSTWEEIAQVFSYLHLFLIQLALFASVVLTTTYEFCLLQRYDKLFERNAKSGSFYLQSKVHRAKECLENVYQNNKQDGTPT
jgi:import inner membrane translocase subunit TIM16